MAKKMNQNMIWIVLAVIGVIFFMQSLAPAAPPPTGDCPDSTATINFSAVSALEQTTSAATTNYVRRNGGLYAASSGGIYGVGDSLEILWDAADYISDVTTYTVSCGGDNINAQLFATDDASLRMFNTDGQSMNSGGDSVNQSAIATGGSALIEVKLNGNDKQSSGDLICVLETTNSTAVDKLSLSGLGGATKVSTPDFYSVTAAGSQTWTYKVPAVIGPETQPGTMLVQLETGTTYPKQSIIMHCYSEQAFIDVDGTFNIGVENSEGTVKYEDDFTFTFFVNG